MYKNRRPDGYSSLARPRNLPSKRFSQAQDDVPSRLTDFSLRELGIDPRLPVYSDEDDRSFYSDEEIAKKSIQNLAKNGELPHGHYTNTK